jgi:Uma2 family endonuclease
MTKPITYPLPEENASLVFDMGANAPIHHQRAIAYLTAGLLAEYRAGKSPYEPLPEMMVGEYSSPTPDVVLYDVAHDVVRVIVEICQTRGVKADLAKVIQLIEGGLYGIQEGFVYDYKTQQWLRYRLGEGGVATESSFSIVLNLDLDQFLR